MIVVGDPANPDGAIVCRACAALPADEQARRRDVAVARMPARSPSAAQGPASTLGSFVSTRV
jgi:hypothetical protein